MRNQTCRKQENRIGSFDAVHQPERVIEWLANVVGNDPAVAQAAENAAAERQAAERQCRQAGEAIVARTDRCIPSANASTWRRRVCHGEAQGPVLEG